MREGLLPARTACQYSQSVQEAKLNACLAQNNQFFPLWLEIDDELMLAPGFAAPPNLDYAGYHQYVEEMLPPESPALYGLHPNAEIEFLTVTSNTLFRTLLEMQPSNVLVREELGQSTEDKVQGLSCLHY